MPRFVAIALRGLPTEPALTHAALVTVAEMSLAFGATTAFEAGGVFGDVVWVDVTGCAHLHAKKEDREGERTLCQALGKAVVAMGYECRVALADGVRVAAAVARFGSKKTDAMEAIVVPARGNAHALAKLPLVALGLGPDVVGWLSKVGAHRVSDLQRLPRPSLAARLGKDAVRVMALLEGDDRTPLKPHVPPEKPTERVVLEYGITHHEALLFVVKRLCDRIAARLEGRVKKAGKLLLRLEVDHGVAGAPAKDPSLPITLASPLFKADELFAVVRAKVLSPDGAARIAIEREEDGTMDVPILALSLTVTEEVAAAPVTQNLFVPEAKADRALPRLVAELSAELGASQVGVLSIVDTWITHERSRLVPYKASPPSRSCPPLVSTGEEMSRLLPVPRAVPRSVIATLPLLRLVSRSEQAEWWKRGASVHDVFVGLWDEGGSRGDAWLTVDGRTGDALLHGWID